MKSELLQTGVVTLPPKKSYLKRSSDSLLSHFYRDFALLLKSGLSIHESLKVLTKQSKNAGLGKVLPFILKDVEAGKPVSYAFIKCAPFFDPLSINIIRAGEHSGSLVEALLRLANFKEKRHRFTTRLRNIMTYPTIVLVLAFFLITSLLVFVIPKFQELFDNVLNNSSLPFLTHWVMKFSLAIQSKWMILLGVIIGLIFAWRLGGKRFLFSRFKDSIVLRFPYIGALIKKINFSLYFKALSNLLENGTEMRQALSIAGTLMPNVCLQSIVSEVAKKVNKGHELSVAFSGFPAYFSPSLISMIHASEETGSLAETLSYVADYYEEDIELELSRITTILEPLLVILMALVVGILVIALFLPLISVMSSLSYLR